MPSLSTPWATLAFIMRALKKALDDLQGEIPRSLEPENLQNTMSHRKETSTSRLQSIRSSGEHDIDPQLSGLLLILLHRLTGEGFTLITLLGSAPNLMAIAEFVAADVDVYDALELMLEEIPLPPAFGQQSCALFN